MTLTYFRRLHPTSAPVDDVRSRHGTLAYLVGIVGVAIHVDAVGYDMQVEDAAIGIPVESHDKL